MFHLQKRRRKAELDNYNKGKLVKSIAVAGFMSLFSSDKPVNTMASDKSAETTDHLLVNTMQSDKLVCRDY